LCTASTNGHSLSLAGENPGDRGARLSREGCGWDFKYFHLHILIECNHVDWTQDALLGRGDRRDGQRADYRGAAHPVTGTVSLFAPSGSAMELAGDTQERSEPVLNRLEEMLLTHLTPHTCRYEPGDLVLWNNMSTLHRGTGVEPTHDLKESRLRYRINVNYTRKYA
jgi:hypothetical protein